MCEMNPSPYVMAGMQNNLGNYYLSLQTRYGDPRIYQEQEAQMRRDEAAVMHTKSKKTEELLRDAYERQRERNRDLHSTRVRKRQEASLQSSEGQRGHRKRTPPARAS
jgi:hypothetical protein